MATGLLLTASCSGDDPRAESSKVAAAFGKAWSAGQLTELSQLTDKPDQARKTFVEANRVLGIEAGKAGTKVVPQGSPSCNDDGCKQQLAVTQEVAGLGAWKYTTALTVRKQGDQWLVAWQPTIYHPGLTADTKLAKSRELGTRASILDRNDEAITEDRTVVRVGVDPAKADPAKTYSELAKLVGINAGELRKEVEAAPKGTSYVHSITMREEAYDDIWTLFDNVPGVVIKKDKLSLAPTSSYARAVLGAVLPATPETLKNAGPLAAETDELGKAGLQEAYQQQLAGKPGGTISVVDRATGDVVEDLLKVSPAAGKPLKTTLDPAIQEAAENAVMSQAKPTAIVAVKASTGEILATANGPGITDYNRAFIGKYAPGSTFKVVTSAALLEGGLQLNDRVRCPKEMFVGGKRFKNAYNTQLPDGPFITAFAHSCNTAVVGQAERLLNDSVPEMAARFGIGEKWDVGLPAFSGSVPKPRDLTDRAATMIGQSRVEMSALGMAMLAATVDSGQPRTPVLLPDEKPGQEAGKPLPDGLHKQLRALMAAVVNSGSAKLLKQPGVQVFAKTGTAEYGSATPLRTHAWMIGFRGDLAFAVIIDDGGGGGKDAGPVARQFLQETRFSDY
ncbi:penicillin-binding transpeptidase domain-containing protein [Flindersiella endophytica]